MTRDEFEQLLSDWLDCRDADAARQLDAAIAARPELARLRDQWLAFETRLRGSLPPMRSVAWDAFRERIAAAIGADAQPQA